jgi:hypothetical protein
MDEVMSILASQLPDAVNAQVVTDAPRATEAQDGKATRQAGRQALPALHRYQGITRQCVRPDDGKYYRKDQKLGRHRPAQ